MLSQRHSRDNWFNWLKRCYVTDGWIKIVAIYTHQPPKKVIANTTSNCQRTIHNANKRANIHQANEWNTTNETKKRANEQTSERVSVWVNRSMRRVKFHVLKWVCHWCVACDPYVCSVATDERDEEKRKKTDVHMNNYCQLCGHSTYFLLKHRTCKFTWYELRSKSHCFDYSNEECTHTHTHGMFSFSYWPGTEEQFSNFTSVNERKTL